MTVYRNNPLLMTVMGANPGRRYRENPHMVIDSKKGGLGGYPVLRIYRGHPTKSFDDAYVMAKRLANSLGREIYVVAHPYVPAGWKPGVEASGLFFAGGPYVGVDPTGEYTSYGRNPGPRMTEKKLDQRIADAWHRLMSGVQVPILDIPRIFRDVKLEIAAGMSVEEAVMRVGERYRVQMNGFRRTRARRNPSLAASLAGAGVGAMVTHALSNPRPRRAASHNPQPNPGPRGKRKIVMTIEKFAQWVKAKKDPAMWRAFIQKFKGYEKWTHGARSRKVVLEWQDVPGITGLWITYNAGKAPETTYIMPGGVPRKGAWKHPWDTMPELRHDAEAGIVIQKLRGKSRISDFYHK